MLQKLIFNADDIEAPNSASDEKTFICLSSFTCIVNIFWKIINMILFCYDNIELISVLLYDK